MNANQLSTPVVFLVFNRPDTTDRVFEAIRRVRPAKLLIVADGPRSDHPRETDSVADVRTIVEKVDWDCEVLKNYSDTNLGCKRRVSSGLKWAFEQVEQAIILEDDCLPHPTFFQFTEELLERYRHDHRITAVCGNNFHFGQYTSRYSYYFSRYAPIWGWATWRRSVELFDPDIPLWPEIRDNGWLEEIFETRAEVSYWKNIFEGVYANRIDSWGYGWFFTSLIQHRLTILPSVNLVSNLGYVANATHTRDPNSPLSNIPVEAMKFPLVHPAFVIRNYRADQVLKENLFSIISIQKRVMRKLRKIQKKALKK